MAKNLPPEILEKLASEAKNNFRLLAQGITKYQNSGFSRNNKIKPFIAEYGSSRVIDYWCEKTRHENPAVIFVPSLINRAHILDLDENSSLLEHIAESGFHPFLVDWGAPAENEKNYSSEHYVARLIEIIKQVKTRYNKPVVLAGYCMGGMLALAACQLIQENIKGLVLLATPWDFHSSDTERINFSAKSLNLLERIFSTTEIISPQIIQTMFYLLQPVYVHNKYKAFAGSLGNTDLSRKFILVEDWINDGMPMSNKLAGECFIDWAHYNITMQGKWKILGETIAPEKIKIPVLAVMPKNDRVVPKKCAGALAEKIKTAEKLYPDAGHVGMIVGTKAKKELWTPLTNWLKNLH